MHAYATVFGLIGSFIGIVSYIPYFRDIFSGKTKPHPFSWLVWGLVSGTAFAAQVFSGGGAGAWTTGVTALACFSIAALATVRGERQIKQIDVICFVGALFGIVLWKLTSNPLTAVVIVTAVHALGFFPTVRKAYARPAEETLSLYFISLGKWGVGLLALPSLQVTLILFPVAVFVMNLSFAIMVVVRRKQLSNK